MFKQVPPKLTNRILEFFSYKLSSSKSGLQETYIEELPPELVLPPHIHCHATSIAMPHTSFATHSSPVAAGRYMYRYFSLIPSATFPTGLPCPNNEHCSDATSCLPSLTPPQTRRRYAIDDLQLNDSLSTIHYLRTTAMLLTTYGLPLTTGDASHV